jgi:hypothetical protein
MAAAALTRPHEYTKLLFITKTEIIPSAMAMRNSQASGRPLYQQGSKLD